MLRAEVLVVEPLRLLASEVHDLLGAVRETIEHAFRVVSSEGLSGTDPGWGGLERTWER